MDTTEKFCSHCKFVIGVRSHLEKWDTWRCGSKNNIQSEKVNIVNGIPYKVFKLEFCKDQRTNAHPEICCGIEGRWFEEYVEPSDLYPQPAPEESRSRTGLKGITLEDL